MTDTEGNPAAALGAELTAPWTREDIRRYVGDIESARLALRRREQHLDEELAEVQEKCPHHVAVGGFHYCVDCRRHLSFSQVVEIRRREKATARG